MESALRRDLEAPALAIRASAANSIVSQALMVGVEDLLASDKTLSRPMHNTLKKRSLAAAFSTDAPLEAMQFSARAVSANVAARRSIWLRH